MKVCFSYQQKPSQTKAAMAHISKKNGQAFAISSN